MNIIIPIISFAIGIVWGMILGIIIKDKQNAK